MTAEQEREAIIAWLRTSPKPSCSVVLAKAIERGEHLKENR